MVVFHVNGNNSKYLSFGDLTSHSSFQTACVFSEVRQEALPNVGERGGMCLYSEVGLIRGNESPLAPCCAEGAAGWPACSPCLDEHGVDPAGRCCQGWGQEGNWEDLP